MVTGELYKNLEKECSERERDLIKNNCLAVRERGGGRLFTVLT